MLDKPETFPWSKVNVNAFQQLKTECPEVFALAYRLNVLSDAFDRYTLELDSRSEVQSRTRQLNNLLTEVNNLFLNLNA